MGVVSSAKGGVAVVVELAIGDVEVANELDPLVWDIREVERLLRFVFAHCALSLCDTNFEDRLFAYRPNVYVMPVYDRMYAHESRPS